jgi:tripeptidyl-peptidase-1
VVATSVCFPPPYFGRCSVLSDHDCGTVEPAYVISTSYSYDEAALSPAYAARQCAEYAKVAIFLVFLYPFLTPLVQLGMMGVTMLFASGDDGVAGAYTTGGCFCETLNPR